MAATHTIETGTAGERGATMATTLNSIPQVAALRPEWVAANASRPERILSALGHPGYGRRYSRLVLETMARTGYGPFEVIYNKWGI